VESEGVRIPAGSPVSGRLLALLAVVVLTQLVQGLHETVRLTGQRDDLQLLHASQDRALEELKKMRTQLEALAGGTARLAEQGNPNARALVDKLKAQGVGPKAPAAPSP
jgi:hypothetical protein